MSKSFATPWPQPASLLCSWDLPGKNTRVGYLSSSRGISWLGIEPASHFLHRQIDSLPLRYQWSMSPKLLCCVRLFVIPWTLACQAPLSMRFFRQEYWSGLPCSPPGDLPHPGMEVVVSYISALAGGFFTTRATWEAHNQTIIPCNHTKISECSRSYISKSHPGLR